MTKSQIFARAHFNARFRKGTSSRPYRELFAAALKYEWEQVAQRKRLAAIREQARLEQATGLPVASCIADRRDYWLRSSRQISAFGE